jgi:hypothetical protein
LPVWEALSTQKRLTAWKYKDHSIRITLAMAENNKKLQTEGGGKPKEEKEKRNKMISS